MMWFRKGTSFPAFGVETDVRYTRIYEDQVSVGARAWEDKITVADKGNEIAVALSMGG